MNIVETDQENTATMKMGAIKPCTYRSNITIAVSGEIMAEKVKRWGEGVKEVRIVY